MLGWVLVNGQAINTVEVIALGPVVPGPLTKDDTKPGGSWQPPTFKVWLRGGGEFTLSGDRAIAFRNDFLGRDAIPLRDYDTEADSPAP